MFKSDVELLVTLLSNYADYLVKQCDAIKRVHSSQQPVCQISKNLSFGYLPLCEAVSPCFDQLEQTTLPTSRDFFQIHHLPDPIPASDGHYKPFSDAYGTKTTKAHGPSLAKLGEPKLFLLLPVFSIYARYHL